MSSVRPRVLVIDRGEELAGSLRKALAGDDRPEIVLLRQTTRAVELGAEDGPWDVIVAGPSEKSGAGQRRLVELRAALPDVGIIVATDGSEEGVDLRSLVRAHPDELVELPCGAASLRNAYESAYRAAADRRGHLVRESAIAARTEPARLATVYTVGGPTGGSGKTMMAINLAHLLAQTSAGKVVLVDVDLQFSEVSTALQLRPTQSIYELLYDEQDRPLDDTALAEGLVEGLTEAPGGFHVLPAPRDPVQADAVGAEEIGRVLTALRTQADYIVIDTPTGLREATLAALDHTDRIVCVTQVDVPGLYNLKTYIDTLDRLGVPEEQRVVVLNKDMPNVGVSAREADGLLGPIAGVVPFDAAVTRALNEGRSLCEALPHEPVAQAVTNVLRPLLPADPESLNGSAGRRWWPFARRKSA